MNDIPLSDASMSEVCARVAYRLIERRCALLIRYQKDPQLWTLTLVRQLDRAGWFVMSFWCSAYAYRLSQGELPPFTRTAFIMRARLGMDFRSVAFIDYKAPRRRDPRVTNRGVTTTATKGGQK
jgi:hypothetical protein